MRDIAHRLGACGHCQAQQALALGDVEQLVFDAIGALTGVHHAADHDVVLLERAPGLELHLGAAGRLFNDLRGRQGAELTGTVQVGTDHGGNVGLRRGTGALVRHGNDSDRRGRGAAADNINSEPLLLRERAQRQQQGGQGS